RLAPSLRTFSAPAPDRSTSARCRMTGAPVGPPKYAVEGAAFASMTSSVVGTSKIEAPFLHQHGGAQTVSQIKGNNPRDRVPACRPDKIDISPDVVLERLGQLPRLPSKVIHSGHGY